MSQEIFGCVGKQKIEDGTLYSDTADDFVLIVDDIYLKDELNTQTNSGKTVSTQGLHIYWFCLIWLININIWKFYSRTQ